jgi:hypothetical protein
MPARFFQNFIKGFRKHSCDLAAPEAAAYPFDLKTP